MTTLLICEKPSAAKKIAAALSDAKFKTKKSEHGIEYYEFNVGKKKHIAVPSVGHIFSIKDISKGKWGYPVYDMGWAPTFELKKNAEHARKYYQTFMKFKKVAKDFIVSTDLDDEGGVIGYNVLRFIFGKKDAKRMMFSTLTKEDLVNAYKNMTKTLDFERIESGLTRHYLDFLWGINVSRALTLSIKNHGKKLSYYMLSAGRVQTPMLYFLIKREKVIKAFKPKPYWEMHVTVKTKPELLCSHKRGKFLKKDEVLQAGKNAKNKKAVVKEVVSKKTHKNPPFPFDLTSLQTNSYRYFGFSPKRTTDIAQRLYSAGYISYPRTSSQKLPPQINYKDILKRLSNIKKYNKHASELLSKEKLVPTEGKKTDPAHPAIYPTREIPDMTKLRTDEKKIYDLIVKRFFSVFGEPAARESTKIVFDLGGELFTITGGRTITKNWMEFYDKYAKLEEVELPKVESGQEFNVKNLKTTKKETTPPQRYSQGSIVRELEKHELGTKATRGNILQTLYDRGYIEGRSIEVTKLGMDLGNILAETVPELTSEKLTRKFEKEIAKVESGETKKEKVIENAKKVIKKLSERFKKNEEQIGTKLEDSIIKTQESQNTLGDCLKCGKKHGGQLKILYSPLSKKKFVGCSSYFRCKKCMFTRKACKCICKICKTAKGKCKCSWKEKTWHPLCENIYPLPGGALIQKQKKICEKCNTPIVRIIRKQKRPFNMCLDPKCVTKESWGKKKTKTKKKTKSK